MSNSTLTATQEYVLRLIKAYILQQDAQRRAPNNVDHNKLKKSHDALLRFMPKAEINNLFLKFRKNTNHDLDAYAQNNYDFKKHCLNFEIINRLNKEINRLNKELDHVDKKFEKLEKELNKPDPQKTPKPKPKKEQKDTEEVEEVKKVREEIKERKKELKTIKKDLNEPPFDESALRQGETKLQSLVLQFAPIKRGIRRWQDRLLLSPEEAFSRKEPFNQQDNENTPKASPSSAPRLTPYNTKN